MKIVYRKRRAGSPLSVFLLLIFSYPRNYRMKQALRSLTAALLLLVSTTNASILTQEDKATITHLVESEFFGLPDPLKKLTVTLSTSFQKYIDSCFATLDSILANPEKSEEYALELDSKHDEYWVNIVPGILPPADRPKIEALWKEYYKKFESRPLAEQIRVRQLLDICQTINEKFRACDHEFSLLVQTATSLEMWQDARAKFLEIKDVVDFIGNLLCASRKD